MNIDRILGSPASLKPSMLQATMGALPSRPDAASSWLFRDPALPFPRSAAEMVVAAVYLLPILAAIQLVGSTGAPPPGTPPAPPSWLLAMGLIVGIVGIAFPTRRAVAAILCVYWLAVMVDFAQAYDNGLLIVLSVLISGGFLLVCDRIEKERQRVSTAVSADASRASFLTGPLLAINNQVPPTVPGVRGTTALAGLQAGEVTKHFDSQLEASINGMLVQRLRSFGWTLFGNTGYSFGSNDIWGRSSVRLGLQGTIHEDVTDESFTAVLERKGAADGPDVVRLVVPSAGAVQEYVRNFIWSWQRSLGVDSQSELAVRAQLEGFADRVVCDASYVADRLSAITRMDPAKRPQIAVVGAEINKHSLLAGGIQFGPDGHWYQLFPIALINAFADLMNGRTPTPTPPSPPTPSTDEPSPDSGDGEPLVSRDRELQVPAQAPSVDGSPARLSVATIGHFSLTVDADDVTSDLQQKPVASFLWLYVLARALRNPKDAPSRPALADELFPNIDPKLQRTRLRQRLNDMQSSLAPAISRCMLLEGERVRFDLSRCTVDAAELRDSATEVTSSNSALDQDQLERLERLVDSIGDGVFLPEWEAIEAKVTSGQSGAGNVIEAVRADVDRWRAAALLAVAGARIARNRPSEAIPYLERVNRSHPDNERAAKALIAAYLETGQTERANRLQSERVAKR
jgi:DNA-binding SARP family transcriptional activator